LGGVAPNFTAPISVDGPSLPSTSGRIEALRLLRFGEGDRQPVLSRNPSQWLCGLAVVVVQQPGEARPADNLALNTLRAGRPSIRLDQLPTKGLMKALPMVVGHEFLDDVPKVALAEKHEVIQALVLDGLDKPLRVRVGVGRRLHLMRTMRVKPFG
jgi:hypothetical protein